MRKNYKNSFLIGVDVGTGSVRAGVFSTKGRLIAAKQHSISSHYQSGTIVEQSSFDIWNAVTKAVREVVLTSGVDKDSILGLGFDATCSLVVLGEDGESLPVGDPSATNRNIIVWMDHRAISQAERINAINPPVLNYVGGRISPEMQTPKLLWLKENKAETYAKAWQFMDLTDFLTWRATGSLTRSTCTLTCKWTYLAHDKGWDISYFKKIGLGDLIKDDFSRIGKTVVEPGTALGEGLSKVAAMELGLPIGVPVAAGLIDAHAGGMGSVGGGEEGLDDGESYSSLAYVFGTSSCTMTTTSKPIFIPGVWGPYFSAMVPGMWLSEGGQSVAGAAIDRLLMCHPYSLKAKTLAGETPLPEWLAKQVNKGYSEEVNIGAIAEKLHVVPEFLGNRSPFAEPNTRSVILGLGMEDDLDSLIALYIAGLCGIGYGLRQIIESQVEKGIKIKQIVISGGASRHDFIRQLLADTTGTMVTVPSSEEPVLLGSAILASKAAGVYPDVRTAMRKMSSFSKRYAPKGKDVGQMHSTRFSFFKKLQSIALDIAEEGSMGD